MHVRSSVRDSQVCMDHIYGTSDFHGVCKSGDGCIDIDIDIDNRYRYRYTDTVQSLSVDLLILGFIV